MGQRIAITIAIAVGLAPGAARAQKASGKPIAVAGLRPARHADFEETYLERLGQAQKLRAVVEEVIGEVTALPVIVHKGLRVIVGKSYLVDFMNCDGKVSCVVRTFKPLKGSVGTLFFGDYAVEKGEYKFRVRLVDLSTGKVLVELTYSVPEKDVEDRALWRRQLAVLFSTAGLEVKSPAEATPPAGEGEAGAGEGEGGKGEGGKEGEGEGGKGEGGEGESGKLPGGEEQPPSSGATNSDELTDDDFGPLVTQVAVETPEARRDLTWIELSAGVSMVNRDFVFLTADGNEPLRPPGFKADWTQMIGGGGKLYPFSHRSGARLLDHIGVWGSYARGEEATTGGRLTRLEAGAGFRMAATRSDTTPTFEFTAGFARHDYALLDRSIQFPGVSYRGARFGVDMRLPLFTPAVAINGAARYIIAVDRGAMSAKMNYGDSRVGGVEVAGSLELRPVRFVFLRIGIDLTRFSFDFEGTGDLSGPEPIGARDRYLTATVASGLLL